MKRGLTAACRQRLAIAAAPPLVRISGLNYTIFRLTIGPRLGFEAPQMICHLVGRTAGWQVEADDPGGAVRASMAAVDDGTGVSHRQCHASIAARGQHFNVSPIIAPRTVSAGTANASAPRRAWPFRLRPSPLTYAGIWSCKVRSPRVNLTRRRTPPESGRSASSIMEIESIFPKIAYLAATINESIYLSPDGVRIFGQYCRL